jgi:hypothetical protein
MQGVYPEVKEENHGHGSFRGNGSAGIKEVY